MEAQVGLSLLKSQDIFNKVALGSSVETQGGSVVYEGGSESGS